MSAPNHENKSQASFDAEFVGITNAIAQSPHVAEELGTSSNPNRGWSRAAGAVIGFAVRAISVVAERVSPIEPSDALSEHFGHAQKRNDPYPKIDLTQSR